MPHDRIGPYQLLRVVASDSRGIVYEARDPELDQRLALWVLPSQPTEARETLPACVNADSGELQHPNIAAVQDRGRHGEVTYIATEFVDGETLAQYLARVGRLPAMQGLALSVQLLSALAHAHQAGLVHGAINLDHLLVTRTGQLKVTGLGWSGPAASAAMQAGTLDALAFIAPEQLIGQPADRRSDLYSAAVVAHVLVTGSLPPAALDAQAGGESLSASPTPAALQALFERGLAQDPDARYPTAAEFSMALLAAVGTPAWVRTTEAAARAYGHRERRWFPYAALPAALRALGSSPAVRRMGLAFGAYSAVAVVAASLMGGLQTDDPAGLAISEPTLAEASPEGPRALAAAPGDLVAAAPASMTAGPAGAIVPFEPLAPAPDVEPQQPPPGLVVMGNRPDAPIRIEARNPERVALAPARAPRSDAPSKRQRSRVANAVRAASPAASCDQESAIAQEMCTAFKCATAEFRKHPICVRMHAEAFASNRLAEPREGP